jgi:hypothetical protein
LNQSPTFSGFTANSPTETALLSGISSPPGWNYVDGYDVVVSKNAFGTAGFGGVTIPLVHNSPAKMIDKVQITNVCDCVVNTAMAFAVQGTTIIASSSDIAQVCFPGAGSATSSSCNLTAGAAKAGPGGLTVPIKNNGSTTVVMTELDLTWPQASNGNLTTVKLNGAANVWQGGVASPSTLTTTDFDATSSNTTQRSIPPGKTMNLTMQFQHPASPSLSGYAGTVKFGTNASCAISFP